jgi:hypothetical protein
MKANGAKCPEATGKTKMTYLTEWIKVKAARGS